MKKRNLTVEEQLARCRRKFRTVLILFLLFVASVSYYIYLNYDYLAFKHFITGNYIYTDALDELYKNELKRDVKGRYFSYFDDVVISVLTGRIREINNDRYTYLYIPEQYEQYKQEEKEEALRSFVKALSSKTAYMRLTNFSKYTRKFVGDNVGLLRKYPYLIIDLRDNYGGDIDAMNSIAGYFLPKGSVISTDRMRITERTYRSKGNRAVACKKIIILQNRNTASSSENLIAALKDNLSDVLLVGEQTFGKGIGQFTMPLKRGFAVKMTTILWYTPRGINIQGKGIRPDIAYEDADILEYALQLLEK